MNEQGIMRKLKRKDKKIEYDNIIKECVGDFIQRIKQDLREYESKTIDDCCNDEIFNQKVDKLLSDTINDLKQRLNKPFSYFCYRFTSELLKFRGDVILLATSIRIYDTIKWYNYWELGNDMIYIEEERRLLSRELIYEILRERGLV